MTVTNTFLNELAKAINGESYLTASHIVAGSTDVSTIDTSDTTIQGELGSRISTSGSRTDNNVEFSAIRSGAVVIDTTNGDDINSAGLLTAETGGELLSGITLGGVTQTTNFDIEFIFDLTVER